MHAGEHDDIGVNARCLARQRQAVAYEVGDAVENLGRLVVMGEDNRIARALERKNGVDVAGEERPLDRRNDRLHALVERRRARKHVGHRGLLQHNAPFVLIRSITMIRPRTHLGRLMLDASRSRRCQAPLPAACAPLRQGPPTGPNVVRLPNQLKGMPICRNCDAESRAPQRRWILPSFISNHSIATIS